MKNLVLILILLTSVNVLSFDDDGREIYNCDSAIEAAMNECTIFDPYDQDDSFDEDCIRDEMKSYGFGRSTYELVNPTFWPRPRFNEYVCVDL